MYLRAGVVSLALLLASRVLGLLRESVQAAAFGSTGLGDAVIVMFTLPDLLVGILFSGALAYVLLPAWAGQSAAAQDASQKRVARALLMGGLLLGLLLWLLREAAVQALAPGLRGEMKTLGATSLGWSAAVLPLAMLAALWVTRLQHERDFVGMYAGSLLVNAVLVLALWLAPGSGDGSRTVLALGCCLSLAMLARLAWLGWRLPPVAQVPAEPSPLPKASIWIWAGLSSGLLLLLPLLGRSLASQGGEGALASFNYAWKLVELPLVLAIQLVASLAFPAITRTPAGSPERARALQVAFLLAWTLACAAIAVVASFSLQIASLLYGWGRMNASYLEVIARWSAIGIWSLLPQALMAVLLTLMATLQRMHVAVWAYGGAVAALAVLGVTGLAHGDGVLWALDAVLAGVALVMLASERRSLASALPWAAMLAPLLVCSVLVVVASEIGTPGLPLAAGLGALFAGLVVASALLTSPLLRSLLRRKAVPAAPGTGQ